MKIIEMCKVVEDGVPLKEEDGDVDPRDWFCVIETKEEELFYDKYVAGNKGLAGETNAEHIWNELVNHAGQDKGLAWGDDDIYAYIRPDEAVPEVGERYKIDNDVWVRTE